MKILHVISQTPDHTGSGKYIQAVMSCAAKRGYESRLVAGIQDDFCLDPVILPQDRACYVRFRSGSIDFPLPGMSDVMPYDSTVFSSMTPSQLGCYDQAFETAIRREVHCFKPDIIHTHHLWLVSAITRRSCPDIPMVTTCHGTCLRQSCLCPEIFREQSDFIKKIDRIMALSPTQKQEIVRTHAIPPNRIDVVGGGFNDALFFWGKKNDPDPVELVYAGKLSRAKGVIWLLRALNRIGTRCFRLHLAGGGSGPEKQICLDLAKALGDRVKVHGALDHMSLAQLMRRSHVFVLPSFYEGLPLVLIEALASGCRVLTTALPGTLEVVGGGNSPWVTLLNLPVLETIDRPFRKDEEELEIQLATALDNVIHAALKEPSPDRETSRVLTQRFTWDSVFDRIEKTYLKALGRL
ncbi:MAG: glycosyltransferase family 4 protein [Pseudomonadota bacterium]